MPRDPGIAEVGMPGHAALRRVSNNICPSFCDLGLYKSSPGLLSVHNNAFEAVQRACDARGGNSGEAFRPVIGADVPCREITPHAMFGLLRARGTP